MGLIANFNVVFHIIMLHSCFGVHCRLQKTNNI